MGNEMNINIDKFDTNIYPISKHKVNAEGLISIVVPTYNAEPFLSICIDSLLNQTYKSIEIIIVDDGSKDKSGDIADNYAKKDLRVKVIHQENGGVSAARNAALAISKGEYIMFVDADDWIEKNACEKILCAMIKADATVCFYNLIMAPEKGTKYLRAPNAPEGVCGAKRLAQEILRHFYPCVNNKCFRREVIMSEQGITKFDTGTRILEDGLWLMQTSSKWQRGVLLNEGLGYRRIWNGSTMGGDGDKEKILETKILFLQTFRKLFPYFEQFGIDVLDEAKEYYMTFAINATHISNFKSERKWLLAIAEEMKIVEENYAMYLYIDIYNRLLTSDKSNKGKLYNKLKMLIPYKLKNSIKKIFLCKKKW